MPVTLKVHMGGIRYKGGIALVFLDDQDFMILGIQARELYLQFHDLFLHDVRHKLSTLNGPCQALLCSSNP